MQFVYHPMLNSSNVLSISDSTHLNTSRSTDPRNAGLLQLDGLSLRLDLYSSLYHMFVGYQSLRHKSKLNGITKTCQNQVVSYSHLTLY